MYATRFAAAARLWRFTYMATKKKRKKEKGKKRGDVFAETKNRRKIKNQETHSSHCIFRVRLFAISFFYTFLPLFFPSYSRPFHLARLASVFYDEVSDILRLPLSPDLDSLSLPIINLCTSSWCLMSISCRLFAGEAITVPKRLDGFFPGGVCTQIGCAREAST